MRPAEAERPEARVEAVLLGVAQDAGVPQAGCECPNCRDARRGAAPRQYAASLALIDRTLGASWLIDATPDFREQFALLTEYAPQCPLRGIVLTHAHAGHYTGLMHLGRESMNTRLLPVYASERMAAFLRRNGPWSQLFDLGNIALCELSPQVPFELAESVTIEALPVPHRAEFSDTFAFVVEAGRRLLYCPDIDDWAPWDDALRALLPQTDYVLLDGTFYSDDELPGRKRGEIPHPNVVDTVQRLRGYRGRARFIHLNHSNPLLREGPELRAVREAGFDVARTGERFVLRESTPVAGEAAIPGHPASRH